jgi:hypothetical protein
LKRRVFHVGVILMVYKVYLQVYCNGMVATPCKQKNHLRGLIERCVLFI